jgi:hypothetical protein
MLLEFNLQLVRENRHPILYPVRYTDEPFYGLATFSISRVVLHKITPQTTLDVTLNCRHGV